MRRGYLSSRFTTRDEDSFQADLRERAVLRRTIRPQARHLFSALAGIDATALDDERFAPPLRDVLDGRRDALLAAIRKRTWGHVVRETDAAALLCAAAFGFDDRFTEDEPGMLWATWLREPPLRSEALTAFALEVLRGRYPVYASLLASAPNGDPEEAFRRVAAHTFGGDRLLVRLALDTATRLREREPDRLHQLLGPAEAAYVEAGSPDIVAPLLARAVQAKARRLAIRCRSEQPPTTDEVDVLSNFLFDDRSLRESLVRIARLARGLRGTEHLALPTTLQTFGDVFRDHIAWLDRGARRARECAIVDPEIANTRDRLVESWYALRDRWNEAFAETLATEWPTLFAFPGSYGPFVVSHILKHVVRPQLPGSKTFLVVLDGCDLPTFLEILDAFENAGVTPASVDVALSAIPTVTSHARRAIFGGDIPKDRIGDDDRAADAPEDRTAFEGQNAYLDGFRRKLFLKGDLGDGGIALATMLRTPAAAPDVIAAVFNDVDDAIASKEHSVLPERTLERCTKALREAFFAAVEHGWRVVVTADHGHTPYRQPDVKASTVHARFTMLDTYEQPPAGTVVFEIGTGTPYRVAALHQLGTHAGPQHLGYHGGVALEEMFVPLAIFDSARADQQRFLPPSWWDDIGDVSVSKATSIASNGVPWSAVSSERALVSASDIRVRSRAALADHERLLRIFERIAEAGSLDGAQLASAVGVPPGRARLFVTGLVDRLRDAGLEPPIAIEDDPLVFRWVGPR